MKGRVPMRETCVLASPTGFLRIEVERGAIASLCWVDAPGPAPETALARDAAAQITAYFEGRRRAFDLPLCPATGLAGRMRAALLAIPFGATRAYGDLAHVLGIPAQAAGRACGANQIPLIVPCHRVLGKTGLGGFSGGAGIETKVALLRHEGAAGLLI